MSRSGLLKDFTSILLVFFPASGSKLYMSYIFIVKSKLFHKMAFLSIHTILDGVKALVYVLLDFVLTLERFWDLLCGTYVCFSGPYSTTFR